MPHWWNRAIFDSSMPGARIAALLIALTVTAQVQCVAACVVRCCNVSDLPPCHQRHGTNPAPQSCVHRTTIAIAPAAHVQLQPQFSNAVLVIMAAAAPSAPASAPRTGSTESPPAARGVSSTILRI